MKYNVDEIQKNMHIRQVEGIGDRLEEDIRNILNRAGTVSYTHLDVYKRQPI